MKRSYLIHITHRVISVCYCLFVVYLYMVSPGPSGVRGGVFRWFYNSYTIYKYSDSKVKRRFDAHTALARRRRGGGILHVPARGGAAPGRRGTSQGQGAQAPTAARAL